MNTCQRCHAPVTGAFCGNCGAPVAIHDEATSTAAAAFDGGARPAETPWEDAPTSAGPAVSQPAQRPTAPAGYQVNRGSVSPSGSSPYGQSEEPERRTTNATLAALVGLVSLVVIGLVAFLVIHPGRDKNTVTQPSPSMSTATSSRASQSSSSTPSATTSTQGQATTQQQAPSQAASQSQTEAPSAVAPAPAPSQGQQSEPPAAPSSAASPTSTATQGLTDVDGYIRSATGGDGQQYAIGRSGNRVTVYGDDNGSARALTTLTLQGGAASDQDLNFVTLSGCSHPIVLWNAPSATGSGAYGWDGSGYQQYRAPSGQENLMPNGGTSASSSEYGVRMYQGSTSRWVGTILYRLAGHDDETGNHFGSCRNAGGADELIYVP